MGYSARPIQTSYLGNTNKVKYTPGTCMFIADKCAEISLKDCVCLSLNEIPTNI